ncbi:hypothetical protein GX411_08620, partial [Candidatus Fermentibacteria bacterium]|nr:hypothetical protein [Candidatus Fermentibacteria bacterium]
MTRHLLTTMLTIFLLTTFACSDGGGPAGPGEPGEGDAVAWFNGLGYTVDLYFPSDGTLTGNAFVTGEVPNDIVALGEGMFLTVNSSSSDLMVFDIEGEGAAALVELAPGSNPWAACASPDEVFVSLLTAGQVAVVDRDSWQVLRYMDAGPNPSGISLAAGRLFVSHSNWPEPGCGGVTILDPASGDSLGFVETPENTYWLRSMPSTGMVHAASSTYQDDGAVTIIDPVSGGIEAVIQTGGSPVLGGEAGAGFAAGDGFSSGGLYIYGEDGSFTEYDTGHCVNGLVALGDTLFLACFPEDAVYLWSLSESGIEGSLQA